MTHTARRHYHFPIFQNWHVSQSGENHDILNDFLNPNRIQKARGDMNEKAQMVDMLRSLISMQHIWDKPTNINNMNTCQDQTLFLPEICNELTANYTI